MNLENDSLLSVGPSHMARQYSLSRLIVQHIVQFNLRRILRRFQYQGMTSRMGLNIMGLKHSPLVPPYCLLLEQTSATIILPCTILFKCYQQVHLTQIDRCKYMLHLCVASVAAQHAAQKLCVNRKTCCTQTANQGATVRQQWASMALQKHWQAVKTCFLCACLCIAASLSGFYVDL